MSSSFSAIVDPGLQPERTDNAWRRTGFLDLAGLRCPVKTKGAQSKARRRGQIREDFHIREQRVRLTGSSNPRRPVAPVGTNRRAEPVRSGAPRG